MTIVEPPVAEEQLPPEPPKRRRSRLTPLGKLVLFLLVLLLPMGAFAGYVLNAAGGSGAGGKEIPVVIEPGASASAIATQLERAGVIEAAWAFRLYARIRGSAGSLRPGEYVFREGMSYSAVFALLEKGPELEFTRLTIPEGKTVRETAAILERLAGIPADEFMTEITSGKHTLPFLPRNSRNLEGTLFPKTYDLLKGVTVPQVVELLHGQFEKETAALDWTRAEKLGVSRYEILIIASMIEREARVPQDRAKISRVIYNRLEKPMRLQIDATVQYGIYLKTGSYKQPLLVEDYQFSSPYNTYLIDGVPPAPIANPGLASIEAALNPAQGDWLYYVLISDSGEHGFAETYDEFIRLKNSR
ncbi:MAG: endolytic transglycosylase MltG [Actinomycetota bacterium]